MGNVIQSSELKESYRYHGHAFLPKADAVPLQAADFLAWEWAKFRDETIERKVRPTRRSLRALMDSRLGQYCGHHLAGPGLARFMEKVRQLGLLQLEENRQAKKMRKRNETKG